MSNFLRFNGATRHDPQVDAWFDARRPDLGAIAREWFQHMRGCGPDVTELLHDGQPTACVGDAAFGYVNAFTSHVNIGFFHGDALDDPAHLLQGSGKFMRHVKARPGALPDAAALQALVRAAHADIKARLRDEPLPASPGRRAVRLVRPALEHLGSYVAALDRGWSADNLRGAAAAAEELARIRADPEAFLASLEDREAKGPAVLLPDGTLAPRIPGFRRWIWDGEFAGSIGFRWQPGTTALPPHCLGHIGYAVVPWKQRKGYATRALKLMLAEARAVGLPFVEVTTDPDNMASQRVIEAAGGRLHERFIKPAAFGGKPGLRYRIMFE
ncbi:MAG: GNAT family N-acetyltransferase [Rubrivivax sp.]